MGMSSSFCLRYVDLYAWANLSGYKAIDEGNKKYNSNRDSNSKTINGSVR